MKYFKIQLTRTETVLMSKQRNKVRKGGTRIDEIKTNVQIRLNIDTKYSPNIDTRWEIRHKTFLATHLNSKMTSFFLTR